MGAGFTGAGSKKAALTWADSTGTASAGTGSARTDSWTVSSGAVSTWAVSTVLLTSAVSAEFARLVGEYFRFRWSETRRTVEPRGAPEQRPDAVVWDVGARLKAGLVAAGQVLLEVTSSTLAVLLCELADFRQRIGAEIRLTDGERMCWIGDLRTVAARMSYRFRVSFALALGVRRWSEDATRGRAAERAGKRRRNASLDRWAATDARLLGRM